MSCIFCKIIAGEIPCYKIYEDENALAFLDINPVSLGHALVVAKKHAANLEEADEETLCRVIKVVKKIGRALKQGLGASGYNVNINNDPAAGQIIPHLHFHMIPRVADDGLRLWPQTQYGDGEAEAVLEKLRKSLNK